MILEFVCQNDNIRLSEELKLHVSRKLYRNIKSSNAPIYVNRVRTETHNYIKKGDSILIELIVEKEIDWPIYESKLDVRYEDDNYLVVYKPHGLLSIPTKSEPRSIYQEIIYFLQETYQELTPSLLNRLDKETRGLMVVAKNRLAANYLQPTHEKMVRKYQCIVHGILENKEGRIETFIDQEPDSHKRFISDSTGKLAISNYKVLKEYEDKSLLEFVLDTGRTHQIRLHCNHLGHPIVGDMMYGKMDDNTSMKLCSYYVKFYNPYTKEYVEVKLEECFNEGEEI